jgi:hypothetical protein
VYTIRDVVKQNYQSLIEEEIPFKPNEKEYLGRYQQAVSSVISNMSYDQLEDAEKIVDLWNAEGAPSDVQLK